MADKYRSADRYTIPRISDNNCCKVTQWRLREKRRLRMKRILLVMSVAALTAAMVLVTAVPAFATIHELARVPADNPGGDDRSEVAGEFPPGLSDAEGVGAPNDGHENGSDNSDKLNSEGPRSEPTLDVAPSGDNQPCRESGDGGSCEGNFAQAIV